MRRLASRFLLMLLLAWLPLQSSWAALGIYYGHAAAASAQPRAGHHDHAHDEVGAAHEGDAVRSAQHSQSGDHPDCAVCHPAASIMPRTLEPAADCARAAPSVAAAKALPAPPLSPPERPNWHSA